MNEAQKTGRRIVSKGAYARVQARRVFWWLDSLLAYLAALSCVAILVGFSVGVLRFAPWPVVRDLAVTEHVWLLLLLPLLIYGCFAAGKACLAHSRKIEPVLPLMAQTLNSLPAPDSLVRASQEPVQAQQAVLLRAARGEAQERQESEQLLRAAGGREHT